MVASFPPRKPKKAPGTPIKKSNPPPIFILGGMVNPDGKVKKGRPPAYDPSFDEACYRLRLLNPNMPNEKLAAFFGIEIQTLYKWSQQHPSFGAAYARGGDLADAEVVASLHHRAVGYEHKATKIMVVSGTVVHEEYTERFAPDPRAAEFLLMNRQGSAWKTKQNADDSAQITVTVVRPKKKIPDQD